MYPVCILCAKTVCNDPAWNRWADRWFGWSDRSVAAAGRRDGDAQIWRRGRQRRRWAAEAADRAAALAAATGPARRRGRQEGGGVGGGEGRKIHLDLIAIARAALKGSEK